MTDLQTLMFRRLSAPDQDGLIRIEVRARNETIAAAGEGLTSASSLVTFAKVLDEFPKQLPASASFSAKSGGCDIDIALETLDRSGHVGIKVTIQEGTDAQGHSATLWLKTQPIALISLARQIRSIADLSSEMADLPT
jgi:hypothetical protein